MPPASFEMLVTTLATERWSRSAKCRIPMTGKAELQRNQAQYLIDTLDVLRQKTQGQSHAARSKQLIESVLHQMRMVFIAVANAARPTAGENQLGREKPHPAGTPLAYYASEAAIRSLALPFRLTTAGFSGMRTCAGCGCSANRIF